MGQFWRLDHPTSLNTFLTWQCLWDWIWIRNNFEGRIRTRIRYDVSGSRINHSGPEHWWQGSYPQLYMAWMCPVIKCLVCVRPCWFKIARLPCKKPSSNTDSSGVQRTRISLFSFSGYLSIQYCRYSHFNSNLSVPDFHACHFRPTVNKINMFLLPEVLRIRIRLS